MKTRSSWDELIKTLETLDEDGGSYHFNVGSNGGSRIELECDLNLSESVNEIKIILNSNGTWEVEIEQSKRNMLLSRLRNRFVWLSDCDDEDLIAILDELEVDYT